MSGQDRFLVEKHQGPFDFVLFFGRGGDQRAAQPDATVFVHGQTALAAGQLDVVIGRQTK